MQTRCNFIPLFQLHIYTSSLHLEVVFSSAVSFFNEQNETTRAVTNGQITPFPRCHLKAVIEVPTLHSLYTWNVIITSCQCPAPMRSVIIRENMCAGYLLRKLWLDTILENFLWKKRLLDTLCYSLNVTVARENVKIWNPLFHCHQGKWWISAAPQS